MDALAVSICDRLTMPNMPRKRGLFIALVFGTFQGIMPLIGYYLGSTFMIYIQSVDHWIAFALLLFIGGKMAVDALLSLKNKEQFTPIEYRIDRIIVQGIATSIDALAVGISLLTFTVPIWISSAVIAVITFIICTLGILFASLLNKILKGNPRIITMIGGIVLIAIGVKILLEHIIV